MRTICAAIVCLCIISRIGECADSLTVLFLPFHDRVQLKEVWKLGTDIPRWYSQTVDTMGDDPAVVRTVSFDSVLNRITRNSWNRREMLAGPVLLQLAAVYNADIIVTGTVREFKVVKHAVNVDGHVGATHGTIHAGGGTVSAPAMGGLQSYYAHLVMDIVCYCGGVPCERFTFDSKEKDRGIKLWIPFQHDYDELNYHYMQREPFGGEHFQKTVVGALMRHYSLDLRNRLLGIRSGAGPQNPRDSVYLQGVILDRAGDDVYLNLGTADHLMLGQEFEVLKPGRPVLGPRGDTLGWSEVPAGLIAVRSVQSSHFSQATVRSESDSLRAGWRVRVRWDSPVHEKRQ